MAKETKIRVRVISTSINPMMGVAVPAMINDQPRPEPTPFYQVNFQTLNDVNGTGNLSLNLRDLGTLKPGQEGELTFTPDAA